MEGGAYRAARTTSGCVTRAPTPLSSHSADMRSGLADSSFVSHGQDVVGDVPAKTTLRAACGIAAVWPLLQAKEQAHLEGQPHLLYPPTYEHSVQTQAGLYGRAQQQVARSRVGAARAGTRCHCTSPTACYLLPPRYRRHDLLPKRYEEHACARGCGRRQAEDARQALATAQARGRRRPGAAPPAAAKHGAVGFRAALHAA